MPAVPLQHAQDQRRRRRRTGPALGVQGQAGRAGLLHLPAHFPLQQRLDQFHPIVQPQQTFHPGHALEPYRHHAKDGLELLVPLLHERLVLVLAQRLLQAQALVVGHEREQSIAVRLPPQRLPVFQDTEAVAPVLDPLVGCVRPRPPRPCLTIFFLHLFVALEPQPARYLLLLQHPLAGGQGLGRAGKGPLPAWRTQLLQALPRPPQPLGAGLAVLFLLLRAAIPQDTIALRAPLRALEPVIDHVGALPPPRVG